MPFTLAHPAAILPLRGRLPLAALVFGCMSPDLEYPLRLAAVSRFSHTLPAVAYFCIPAGLLCLAVWRLLVREPAFGLLPDWIRTRICRDGGRAPRGLSGIASAVAAVLLGALTHVAWDSFTHDYGWMTGRWPLLKTALLTVEGYELRLFSLLQHGSSIAGLVLVAASAASSLARTPARPMEECPPGFAAPLRKAALGAMAALTVAGSVAFGVASASAVHGIYSLRIFAAQAAIAVMALGAGSILLFSLCVKLARTIRRSGGARRVRGA